MKWLRALFGLCQVLHEEIAVYGSCESEKPFATDYILRCERCGDMKRRRL